NGRSQKEETRVCGEEVLLIGLTLPRLSTPGTLVSKQTMINSPINAGSSARGSTITMNTSPSKEVCLPSRPTA
ncbi:Hypothetical protein, putative, partial [Bodo saltans]